MQLKTIFNRVTKYKPFVVESAELVRAKPTAYGRATLKCSAGPARLVGNREAVLNEMHHPLPPWTECSLTEC